MTCLCSQTYLVTSAVSKQLALQSDRDCPVMQREICKLHLHDSSSTCITTSPSRFRSSAPLKCKEYVSMLNIGGEGGWKAHDLTVKPQAHKALRTPPTSNLYLTPPTHSHAFHLSAAPSFEAFPFSSPLPVSIISQVTLNPIQAHLTPNERVFSPTFI